MKFGNIAALSKDKQCEINTEADLQKNIKNWYFNYETPETSNIKFIGWPYSNKFSKIVKLNQKKVATEILKESEVYNTKEEAIKDNKEIIIDVEKQEFIINMQRNETLVKER